MAIALTTEAGPTCNGMMPLAALELFESPGARREGAVIRDDVATTVQVVDGVVYVATDEHDYVLTPGDATTIAAGTAYRRWNAGDDEARWVEVYCTA